MQFSKTRRLALAGVTLDLDLAHRCAQSPKALKTEQQLLKRTREGTQRRDRSKYPRAKRQHGELKLKPLYSRRPIGRVLPRYLIPRKEVIQPHLQVRLPCYDFTPIASPTFVDRAPKGFAAPTSGIANFRGVTGGVYKARERIHRGILIRDY